MEANFILCFRAKESSVPVQRVEEGNNGRTYTKTEVVNQGFVPIGGDDFVYECTLCALLPPAARGVPMWKPELVGERRMVKVPEQFRSVEELHDQPLNEELGEQLARWALGRAGATDGQRTTPPAEEGSARPAATPGKRKSNAEQAKEWTDWFVAEVRGCGSAAAIQGMQDEQSETLHKLRSFPDLHARAQRALDDALASL
jgi:hypothetical protein